VSTTRKAKRAKKRQEEDGRVIVETSRGVRGACQPIAMMLEAQEQNIRGSIEWPEVPTYSFEDVAGNVIERVHTQATIDDPATSEEDRAAWADYLLAQQAAQTEFDDRRNNGIVRLLAVEGFEVLDGGDDWERRHELYGMAVPDDEFERTVHYFQTEVIGTQDDVYQIMLGIYRASGYDEEVMAQVEAGFRAEVGQAGTGGAGDAAESGAGDPDGEAADDVVREPDVDDDGRTDQAGDRPGTVE
jgi:hypothetical protein